MNMHAASHIEMPVTMVGAVIALQAAQGMAVELSEYKSNHDRRRDMTLSARAASILSGGGLTKVDVFAATGIPIGYATSRGDFNGASGSLRRSLTCWLSNGHGFTKEARQANVELLRGVLRVAQAA